MKTKILVCTLSMLRSIITRLLSTEKSAKRLYFHLFIVWESVHKQWMFTKRKTKTTTYIPNSIIIIILQSIKPPTTSTPPLLIYLSNIRFHTPPTHYSHKPAQLKPHMFSTAFNNVHIERRVLLVLHSHNTQEKNELNDMKKTSLIHAAADACVFSRDLIAKHTVRFMYDGLSIEEKKY